MEQLEREYGAALIHICCKCEKDEDLESNALILFNEYCSTHGNSWHRLMLAQADGSFILAMPVDKNRKIQRIPEQKINRTSSTQA